MYVRYPLWVLMMLIPFLAFSQRARRRPVTLAVLDSCSTNISEAIYGGPGADNPSDIIPTGDGGYLVVATTGSFGNGGLDGYLVKLNGRGIVQWSKAYGGPAEDRFTRGKATADGGFIIGGVTKSYGHPAGDCWLVKTDAAGNLQWSAKYGDGNAYGEYLFDVIQTSDGGYAFTGDHKYTPGVVDAMVVRTDATGNLLWAKAFDSGGSDECPGIAEDRDSLIVSAFFQSFTGYDAVVMKLPKATGDLAWMKSWDFDGRTNRLGYVYVQADGYLVVGGNADGFGVLNPWHNVVKTDFNGNIIYVRELRTTPEIMNGFVAPTADGGYVVENGELPTDADPDVHLSRIAKDGSLMWSKRYRQPGPQIHGGITATPDGGFTGVGTISQLGTPDIFFLRTDANGETAACPSEDVTAINRVPVVNTLSYTWTNKYDITLDPALTLNPGVMDVATADSFLCRKSDYCKGARLAGIDSICGITDPILYTLQRGDTACHAAIQWSIDNSFADILPKTDSSIELQFKRSGSVTLYSNISSACGVFQDSLQIQAYATTPVDLGPPVSFCPGDSLLLDAGNAFKSYAWSTGATTSRIYAHQPGDYWVQVVNAGGECLSGDTVSIGIYPAVKVVLGPDVSICRDSVHVFDAGPGFASYTWQDGSSGSTFKAFQAGAYSVTVTSLDGCRASDTARILSILAPPQSFLAPAAEICSQGQLPFKIDAIGAWSSYLWSDSSTSRSIIIETPGQYWLEVTNAAGCRSREVIDINGIACPLGIFFPGAFSPNNDGRNDLYRPSVYALLDTYHLEIFDRWGVLIFATNDPHQGWDGRFNGQPQPTGQFVWFAQYRLRVDPGKDIVKKGTLMLVR